MEKRKNISVFFVLAVFVSIGYQVIALPLAEENVATDSANVKSYNITKTLEPTPTPTRTPTPTLNTTTSAPTTTTPVPNNTTTIAPTKSTPVPNNTTTIAPTVSPTTPTPTTVSPTPSPTSSTTTAIPPQPKPDRSFDLPSFVGGIILALGVLAIGYVVYKFYRARTDPNYRTL